VSASDSPRESCISLGRSVTAAPPSWAIATENEIRVRVEGCAKKRPSVFPRQVAAAGRLSARRPGRGSPRSRPGRDPTRAGSRDRKGRPGVGTSSRPPLFRRRDPPPLRSMAAFGKWQFATWLETSPARDLGGDLLMGVAERDPFADESLGSVGRAEERIGARGGHALRGRIRGRGRAQPERRARPSHRARACEHRRLVLLEVAVVGEREALHRREQAGEAADRPSQPSRGRARRRRRSASAASSTSRSPRPRAGARSRTRRSSRGRAPRRSARGA